MGKKDVVEFEKNQGTNALFKGWNVCQDSTSDLTKKINNMRPRSVDESRASLLKRYTQV